MVHLRPLPGSPHWEGSLAAVVAAALRDARALSEGGVDGIMIENFGDTPFVPSSVDPVTIAAMTAIAGEIRRVSDLPLGINVLRNDAAAALAIAAVTGAAFIRVNVHTGAMLTDQGWIDGRAHETMRLRAALRADVAVLADVLVKHATPPAGLTLEDAARDTWERGHADGLIVSGSGTGLPTDPGIVRRAHEAVPEAPILIGSGITPGNATQLLEFADAAIAGSALKVGGVDSPVSVEKVKQLLDVVSKIR